MSNDPTLDAFFTFLNGCVENDDRASLANLRCALRKNLKHRAWPLLARFGGVDDEMKEYDHKARVIQTIAGLFATYPTMANRDFGVSCQLLMDDEERKKFYSKNPDDMKYVGPVARRFQYILSSEKDEICDRVVRIVMQMKANQNSIPVNYYELFNGLLEWGDKIKTRWAGSFWKVQEEVPL